jgi:hypothetical protein
LPSLEVKIHPPDEFQPKVQAEIKKLETERETSERKNLEELEKAYNQELMTASDLITVK